ncbi:hypothetical protein NL349_28845, partial [Klebsiella pneumoniae]|nr:hypothetical protein [Klebsiella pneumoniae]
PWAVVSDAPELVLEVLVDERDGWLDVEPVPQSAPKPGPGAGLDLPRAPRRVKRPDLLPPSADSTAD